MYDPLEGGAPPSKPPVAGLTCPDQGRDGGGHGSRTRDPDVANVVLSQLS